LTQQNFKKALECNLIVSSINDSILKTEIQQRFAEIKDKQDNERKQRAIAFLTKENEIQKLSLKQTSLAIYVMTISLFLLIIIGVLLIFQARLKARHKQMDIEQNLLRSQMNPHFIFNALIAIQSFIYKKNSSEAARYLTNFARLIRLVLSNSQEEFVTLKREIDTLSNYLSLQKLRFDDKFDYSLIIDPEINTENIKIPPMLAQPFVENAIEHGILGLDSPGRIMINFSFVTNSVLIEITDNGIGREKGREMRKKTDKSHESYGTRITEERIHSHNRKYSSKLRLTITDLFDENNKAAGTKVVLSIPNHVE
jgi:LytS/YehU family sensor histidine kinase